jgi:hypothetical protein
VSDVDSDLRTLLQEKAEEARIGHRVPTAVLRRSRRRRVANTVLAGTITIGAVAGTSVGVRMLLQETAAERGGVRPGGTPDAPFYPFIFPSSRDELEATAAEVAQGSMPMWTDPEGTVTLYAVNMLGWDMDDVAVDVRGDDPITAVMTNPTLNEAAGAKADLRTAVFLAQVPGSRDPPMYAVLAARAEDMDLEPIGPDEQFGAEGIVAFRGRLRAATEGTTVLLTVNGEPGVAATPEPDGHFEVEAEVPGGIGPATLLSVAVVDRSGRTLALTSARLASPIAAGTAGGASEPVQVATSEELPEQVILTRQAILDAAQVRDWGALRELIPDRGFTFSFGGHGDPIRYWRELESEGHVPVLGDILPAVLGTEPGRSRGVYIWPSQAAEDPTDWDEQDLEALRQIHAEEDIRSFQEIGLYVGWRVGIDRDGTWVFFVAGD